MLGLIAFSNFNKGRTMYGLWRTMSLFLVLISGVVVNTARTSLTPTIPTSQLATSINVSPATMGTTRSARHMETASRVWHSGWQLPPNGILGWDTTSRIPMNKQASENSISRFGRVDLEDLEDEARGKNKYYKKYKKYMLPLLLAYKLKFFTLVPILIGGLVLLTGATGLAGFFFALFAATMGLKGGGDH